MHLICNPQTNPQPWVTRSRFWLESLRSSATEGSFHTQAPHASCAPRLAFMYAAIEEVATHRKLIRWMAKTSPDHKTMVFRLGQSGLSFVKLRRHGVYPLFQAGEAFLQELTLANNPYVSNPLPDFSNFFFFWFNIAHLLLNRFGPGWMQELPASQHELYHHFFLNPDFVELCGTIEPSGEEEKMNLSRMKQSVNSALLSGDWPIKETVQMRIAQIMVLYPGPMYIELGNELAAKKVCWEVNSWKLLSDGFDWETESDNGTDHSYEADRFPAVHRIDPPEGRPRESGEPPPVSSMDDCSSD